jgi:DNA-binding NarL/FixJ family response regulator
MKNNFYRNYNLTPRERQVAELITRGYTNPQISAALTITRETTKTYVSNILAKLGVASRYEVAAALGDKTAGGPASRRIDAASD